jgi:hypothetical protein
MTITTTPQMSAIKAVFSDADLDSCPFTIEEIDELESRGELLVYVPPRTSMEELAQICGVSANFSFSNERLIKNVMVDVPQWFVTGSSARPELLYRSGTAAARAYEDEGLHGMDMRRYLAFVAVYQALHGERPDRTYWTFLLSGKYDRSGVSIVGFDDNDVLSHHGWMRSFRAKFTGSRYVVLAPRIEVTDDTAQLRRAYRGDNSSAGKEAATD